MYFCTGAKVQLTKGKTQVIDESGKPATFDAQVLSQERLQDNLSNSELEKLTPGLVEMLEHAADARKRLLNIESSMSMVEETSDGSVSYFPITVSRYL